MSRLSPASRAALLLAALASVAACSDSTAPGTPAPLPHSPADPGAVKLACTASVAQKTVRCAPDDGAGARADRIVGLGGGVTLHSSNIGEVADTFAFDMTVTNGLGYPIGTSDGVNPDPNGIRVFFADGVHVTQGSGSIEVANADGVGLFTAANQPYFAYQGILQPDATTAPKRWKLRYDPTVLEFSFTLYISVPVPPGGGHVYLTVLQPAANSVVPDTFVVKARIDSASASISSVHATVAGHRVLLTPVSPGVVQGTIDLSGLAPQPVQLVVDAATVHGDTGSVTVPLTKDAPPRLVIAAPGTGWVATPNLRIDVDCVDDDPGGCTQVRVDIQAIHVTPGTTGVHTDVSLAAYEGQQVTVAITAYDSHNQQVTKNRVAYVESSPSLVRVDSAGDLAVDVDSTRLLFRDIDGVVYLHDRSAGTTTRLLYRKQPGLNSGALYPGGALFAGSAVYDWHGSGYADSLTTPYYTNFAAQGNWAIWRDNVGTLYRRDMGAHSTTTVATGAALSGNNVGPNGDVVYWGATDRDVYRYRSGVVTPLTADADNVHWNVNPVTDGTNVVYFKSDQNGNTSSLQSVGRVMRWNGSESALSATGGGGYAVNAGWIAYGSPDGGANLQVHVVSPLGVDQQVTFSGGSNSVRAVGSDGSVAFTNGGAIWALRPPYTAAPTRVAKDWSAYQNTRVLFHGSQLLFFLSNSVFEVSF